MYILWTKLSPKCYGDVQAHPSPHHTRLHRTQGGPDPPGQAGRALLRLSFQLGQADTSPPLPAAGPAAGGGPWKRQTARSRGSPPPPPQEGRTRRSEEAPPAGPSPPHGRPRPGRAAAEAEVGSSNAAPRGTRPGPTGAPRRGRRGWGRRAPPHLDLPTPLSPMMSIFRVVSTSSSIPSARPARPDPDRRSLRRLRRHRLRLRAPPPLFSRPLAAGPAHAPRAPQVCQRRGEQAENTPAPAGGACAQPPAVCLRPGRPCCWGAEGSGERPEVAARPCAGPAASGMSSAPVRRPQGGGDCPWVFSFCWRQE